MPRLRLGFDGAATTEEGSSLAISFADFNLVFGDRQVRFLDLGTEDVANASGNVVLEVGANELKPPLFGTAGLYLIEGLSPADASEALRKLGRDR